MGDSASAQLQHYHHPQSLRPGVFIFPDAVVLSNGGNISSFYLVIVFVVFVKILHVVKVWWRTCLMHCVILYDVGKWQITRFGRRMR